MIFLGILIGVIISLIVYFILCVVIIKRRIKAGLFKDCFCNHCRRTFSLEDYLYCPYCGNLLDYHEDDPCYDLKD